MRIAFAISKMNDNGGAERVISVLASSFAERGDKTFLINNVKADKEYHLHDNVRRFFLEDTKFSKLKFWAGVQRILRFRNICKKEQIDVVVAFMGMSKIAVWAGLGTKTRTIISLRNDPNWIYPKVLERIYVKLLFSFANGAVFQTKQALDWAPEKLKRKSKIILNPISSLFFNVKNVPQANLLVATGRLVKQKNYEMMLSAMFIVVKQHPNIVLRIYGEGTEMEILKTKAVSLNIQKNIEFCGVSSDIATVLSTAELFLLSSNVEGLPNGLMEAMTVGVPSIATDCPCGGPEMLLGNNERGILVPVNDYHKMAEAICALLDNEEKRNELGKKAHEFAMQFHVTNVIGEWDSYIKKVMAD